MGSRKDEIRCAHRSEIFPVDNEEILNGNGSVHVIDLLEQLRPCDVHQIVTIKFECQFHNFVNQLTFLRSFSDDIRMVKTQNSNGART